MTARTMDALNALKKLTSMPNQVSNMVWMSGVMKLIAKYPYTTDGMPASISVSGLRTLRNLSEAYSDKNIALPNPRGTAIDAEIRAIMTVPVINGKTPKLSGDTFDASGRHVVPVKNFNRLTSGLKKNWTASLNNEKIIPMVMRTEKIPQANKIAEINFSE